MKPQRVQRSNKRIGKLCGEKSLTTSTNVLRKLTEIHLTTNQVGEQPLKCSWVLFFLWFFCESESYCSVVATGLYCSRNWDGWLCWEDTPAGTYTFQNCPNYFDDFDPTGMARDRSLFLKICRFDHIDLFAFREGNKVLWGGRAMVSPPGYQQDVVKLHTLQWKH